MCLAGIKGQLCTGMLSMDLWPLCTDEPFGLWAVVIEEKKNTHYPLLIFPFSSLMEHLQRKETPVQDSE